MDLNTVHLHNNLNLGILCVLSPSETDSLPHIMKHYM